MIGRAVICSQCWREATCRAVLDVQHAPRRVFCDSACMIAFLREVYIDPEYPARAAAAPSPVVGPPSAAGGGAGGATGRPFGEVRPAPVPPTFERFAAAFLRAVRS
jgi:hypothetical protein